MARQCRYVFAAAALAVAAALPATPASAFTQHDTDACVNRSNTFSHDQQVNGCTEAIRSGRWSGKNLSWAYANRCIAHKDKEEYDRAMTDCNRALELDPRNDHAYNTRGAIYHLTQKYDKAIDEYSKAIRLNATSVDAFHNRGMSYAAKGDYDTAIADYNAALKINSRDALALYERGLAKEKLGNREDGEADIGAAKKIDPHIAD